MEDAATAEISRSQLWQWLNNKSSTNDKQKIEKEYIDVLITDEVEKIRILQDETSKLDEATDLFKNLIFDSNFEEFLTLPAYNLID